MKNWLNIIVRLPFIGILLFLLLQNCCAFNLKGCFVSPTYIHQTVLIDSKFTEKEADIIQHATEEWTKETHGIARYDVIRNFDTKKYYELESNGLTIVVFKASKNDAYIKRADKEHNNTILGYYDHTSIGPIISIVDDRLTFAGPEYYHGVVVHEFGHALGLKHREIENSVMYPTMDKSAYHLTQPDIDQFCENFTCWKSDFEKP